MMVDANTIVKGDEVKGLHGHTTIKVDKIEEVNNRYHFIGKDGHYLPITKDRQVYKVE